jgi:uncharacterized protein with PIN domain
MVDASAIYAFFVQDAPEHWAVAGDIELTAETDELVVSPFAVAEVHAMIGSRIGPAGQRAALEEFARGAWVFASISIEHMRAVCAELERDPTMTLARASSLVLAADRREALLTVNPGG